MSASLLGDIGNTLRQVVDDTEGSMAALVMGFDGLALEKYVKDDAMLDAETIGAEYSVVITQIKNAAEMLDAGQAQEVSIQADKLTTVIRLINEEYFIALAMVPGGNLGKARFLLRINAGKLKEALS